jgi:hypothetical protein
MKTIILILAATVLFFSCSKESQREQEAVPAYIGVYHSASLDTSYVTQKEGARVSIKWAIKPIVSPRIVFDSVYVNDDLTFTVNQFVNHGGQIKKAIGTGLFVNNTIKYHFIMNTDEHVIYEGVKYQ